MKKMRVAIAIFCFVQTLVLSAQDKCYDYACMMAKAREYLQARNYEAAFNSAMAAKRYSGADINEVDALANTIFTEINQLRDRAEAATEKAKAATRAAELAREDAIRLSRIAEQNAQTAQEALRRVDTLVRKATQLANTFSDGTTYQYLCDIGHRHFAFDTIAQQRDYQNALTYFALARFLRPNDTLGSLVKACQKGIAAEAHFIAGRLEKARFEYDSVAHFLGLIQHETRFESWRQAQVKEVEELFRYFRRKNTPSNTTKIVLEGHWWTLPEEFKQYQLLSELTYKNNQSNFERFPEALDALPQLNGLRFEYCNNVKDLKDWNHTKYLQSLALANCPNLYRLGNLEHLPALKALEIDNCPALTLVEGCRNLERFTTRRSAQVRTTQLLANNPQLQMLDLADLTDDTLRIENLHALHTLGLRRLKTNVINGLDKNESLTKLSIEELRQLTAFAPPPRLNSVQIDNCDSLKSIGNWAASEHLNQLLLFENERLQQLPDWERFPKLQTLVIQNENHITHIPHTKQLKNVQDIYILNNPNLVTNSINAGFGFEWGVNVSGVKLEFEHRRRFSKFFGLDMGGKPDLGIKAVASYVRKKFDYAAPALERKSDAFILGGVANYYSPFWMYAGLGVGLGRLRNQFSDNTEQRSIQFVWINNLGLQVAPYFLKKDKVSLNMDLYTVFAERDYYILPSFGLTYYRLLGFHPRTHLLRPGDARRHIYYKGNRKKLKDVKTIF